MAYVLYFMEYLWKHGFEYILGEEHTFTTLPKTKQFVIQNVYMQT